MVVVFFSLGSVLGVTWAFGGGLLLAATITWQPPGLGFLGPGGQHFYLAGVILPQRAGEELSGQRLQVLEQVTRGQQFEIIPIAGETAKDRYGRQAAILRSADDLSLQEKLLEQGLVMLAGLPHSRDLLLAWRPVERAAREAGRGLWAEWSQRVLTAEEARYGVGGFRVVRAEIKRVGLYGDQLYLDTGENWREDFTLKIEDPEGPLWRDFAATAQSLVGKLVLVRGWIHFHNGAMMTPVIPEQIEVLTQ